MLMGKEISIILPIYNEGKVITYIVQSVLDCVPKIYDNYEVILVNDGSTDQTGVIIEKLAKDYMQLRVVHLPKNMGYGAALLRGFKSSKYPSVFFMDTDGQFRIADLYRFVPYTDSCDIIIGKRVIRQDQLYRVFAGKLYNFLICVLFKINIKDITCGFKLIKKSVLEELQLESRGGFLNAEMLIKALRKGYAVKEIEVRHYPRMKGKPTGASLSSFITKVVEMFWLWRKFRHRIFI